MDFIYKAIMNGELTAYSPLYDDFGEGTALTIEDIRTNTKVGDTYTYDEMRPTRKDPPDSRASSTIRTLRRCKIQEDWIFDEETSTLVVRIMGMALSLNVSIRLPAKPIGDEIMFWLYYPDLRNILVRHEVFNEKEQCTLHHL